MEIHFGRNTRFFLGCVTAWLFAVLPYVWLLPTYFPGYSTYFFFLTGIFGVLALSAGYVFSSLGGNKSVTYRIVVAMVGGTALAATLAFIAVSIIIWTRGS
jgi:hypothetical protein